MKALQCQFQDALMICCLAFISSLQVRCHRVKEVTLNPPLRGGPIKRVNYSYCIASGSAKNGSRNTGRGGRLCGGGGTYMGEIKGQLWMGNEQHVFSVVPTYRATLREKSERVLTSRTPADRIPNLNWILLPCLGLEPLHHTPQSLAIIFTYNL